MTDTHLLEHETLQLLDAMIESGRFSSREEGIRESIRLLHISMFGQEVDLSSLDADTRAAIEEGLADADAGRTEDADAVFARLRARYAIWPSAAE